MNLKPRIGISMRLEIETDRFYLGRDYSEALHHFGALPLHVALIPDRKYIASIIENLDGILLPGSDSDVDPRYYGEFPHPRLKRVVPEKDETDFLLLDEAAKRNLPVFGICFGMQSLNVWSGGTLYQDLESQHENCGKHEQGAPLRRNSHQIEICEEKSILRLITKRAVELDDSLSVDNLGSSKSVKLNNCSMPSVNSHHHQAVKEAGRDLTVTARAADGVIECVEDTSGDKFLIGVQWHPELSYRNDVISAGLFKEFVERCRKTGEK